MRVLRRAATTDYPLAVPSNAAVKIAFLQPPPSTVDVLWWHWPTDEFAAWGQWAGGIGSIFAVVVAVVVLIRDRRLHNRQMENLQKEQANQVKAAEAARRARQLAEASAVVVELKPMKRPNSNSIFPGVCISNHGSAPVLEVSVLGMVFADDQGVQHSDWAMRSTVAWNRPARSGPLKAADALGPGGHIELPGLGIDGVSADMLNWGTAVITLGFRDVEGQWWRRVGAGEPDRVEASAVDWRTQLDAEPRVAATQAVGSVSAEASDEKK